MSSKLTGVQRLVYGSWRTVAAGLPYTVAYARLQGFRQSDRNGQYRLCGFGTQVSW